RQGLASAGRDIALTIDSRICAVASTASISAAGMPKRCEVLRTNSARAAGRSRTGPVVVGCAGGTGVAGAGDGAGSADGDGIGLGGGTAQAASASAARQGKARRIIGAEGSTGRQARRNRRFRLLAPGWRAPSAVER